MSKHWQNGRRGPLSNAWNGGRRITGGYVYLFMPDHPHAIKSGYVAEHIYIASKALGKPLPPKAIVHHADGDSMNNTPSNLVICPDDEYHKLLHMRMRAKKACGHANYFKCRHCGKWDDPKNLYISPRWKYANHRKCHADYVALIAEGQKETQ